MWSCPEKMLIPGRLRVLVTTSVELSYEEDDIGATGVELS